MWVIRRLEACYNVILLQVKEKQKGILDGSYPVVMVEVKPVFLTQLTPPCISLIKNTQIGHVHGFIPSTRMEPGSKQLLKTSAK